MPDIAPFARAHPRTLTFWENRIASRRTAEIGGRWKSLEAVAPLSGPTTFHSITAEGLSFGHRSALNVGTLLSVELLPPSCEPLRRLVRVAHVRPDVDGGQMHRVVFLTPLTTAELQALAGGG
jgi:hypothetical protein